MLGTIQIFIILKQFYISENLHDKFVGCIFLCYRADVFMIIDNFHFHKKKNFYKKGYFFLFY